MPVRDGTSEAAPSLLRQDSQRLILQRLRRLGEASRADLARDAALTHTAVGQIVKQLERAGLVRMLGRKHEGQRGQPATLLTLDARGAYAIGVRLDQTRFETVLIDLAGAVMAQRAHDRTPPPPRETLEQVRADIDEFVRAVPAARRRRIAGIGIARPHLPIDATWDGFDIAGELERAFGWPVLVENDGTAAAIAELFHGHAADDFLYVFIGAAIGGGIVLGGQAVRGSGGNAADLGAIPAAASRLATAPQPRGGHGTLGDRASVAALLHHLRNSGESAASVTAARRTAGVEAWLDDSATALVEPLLIARALLDVPLVVIDGDLPAPLLDALLDRLASRLRVAVAGTVAPPLLRRGSFGAVAGALGAATLPLFLHFGPGASRIGTAPRMQGAEI